MKETFVIEPVRIKARQMFLSSDSQWGGWVSCGGGYLEMEMESVGYEKVPIGKFKLHPYMRYFYTPTTITKNFKD